jgi:2-haloacid dehalogenase/putative hydrolase of the HAD superfamily
MVKAIFCDFYGTVVHEDGEIIKKVCKEVAETGLVEKETLIDAYWWNEFQTAFINSFGDNFQTQRVLEYNSLARTIQHFKSTADVYSLSNMMFEHWIKPPIFDEAKQFFKASPVPIYIVSNIDRADVLKAIKFHQLKPAEVFTSEDAKSYKPRPELFELALHSVGLNAEEVLHIGDSLSSDVKGASALGINTLWLNRSKRQVPNDVMAIENLLETFDTPFFDD